MTEPEYQREQTVMQQRYLDALAAYTRPRFGARHEVDDDHPQLAMLEEAMLNHPPLCEADDGMLLPRGKGLVEGSPLIDEGRLPRLEAMSFAEAGMKVIPVNEWSDIIEDPNRTPPTAYCPFTLDQGSVGSCGAEGSVGALMERRVADGQEHVLLNPYDPYHTTSGGRDGGSSPQDNMAYLQKYGCASQAVWPRSKGWRQKPSDEARQDALQYRLMPDGIVWVNNWEELGTCVLKGFAVPWGYAGHWIFAVDLVSTTRLEYLNSWGRGFGNNGRGTAHKNSVYWSYGVCAVICASDRIAA